jgi:hypothetical protein
MQCIYITPNSPCSALGTDARQAPKKFVVFVQNRLFCTRVGKKYITIDMSSHSWLKDIGSNCVRATNDRTKHANNLPAESSGSLLKIVPPSFDQSKCRRISFNTWFDDQCNSFIATHDCTYGKAQKAIHLLLKYHYCIQVSGVSRAPVPQEIGNFNWICDWLCCFHAPLDRRAISKLDSMLSDLKVKPLNRPTQKKFWGLGAGSGVVAFSQLNRRQYWAIQLCIFYFVNNSGGAFCSLHMIDLLPQDLRTVDQFKTLADKLTSLKFPTLPDLEAPHFSSPLDMEMRCLWHY